MRSKASDEVPLRRVALELLLSVLDGFRLRNEFRSALDLPFDGLSTPPVTRRFRARRRMTSKGWSLVGAGDF